MAKISLTGNIGNVETGVSKNGESHYISFSVAEQFSYFDQSQNDWIEKGTQWHNCIIWVKDNEKKMARLMKFIVKGAGVMVIGRTSINPAVKEDHQGNKVEYLNPFINVDDIALTTERLEQVTYKPKAVNPAVTDPAAQQQTTQSAGQEKTPFDDAPGTDGNPVNMSDGQNF